MDAKKFQRKAYILGKEHSLSILKYLQTNGWDKASDVARELDIHTATATKYLQELEEIDILKMRKAKGETREVKEYRLLNPLIDLEYDLSEHENQGKKGEAEFYRDLFQSILERTKEVYGSSVENELPILQGDQHIEDMGKRDMIDLINELLNFNEENIGLYSTNRLVRRAGMKILPSYKNEIDFEKALDYFPNEYTKMLRRNLE